MIISALATAQSIELQLVSQKKTEQKIIDSLIFKKNFLTEKNLHSEIQNISNVLYKKGYLNHQIVFKEQIGITYLYMISFGKKTLELYITSKNIDKNTKTLLNITADTIKIPFEKTENYLQNFTYLLEQSGYGASAVQLINFETNTDVMLAELIIKQDKKRQINTLKIIGYDNFPNTIKHIILKKYKHKALTSKEINQIYTDFNQLLYVKQLKKPEILLKQDSTEVYVYLEPKNSNTFDGFVGFTTNENGKASFTGNINVGLQNIFNSGEKIQLHWTNNGEKRSEINLSTEIPYIFKSNFLLNTQVSIVKNDSLFQNTNLGLGFAYSFNQKIKIGIQYNDIQSTKIQKENLDYQSFKKKYTSLVLQTHKYDFTNALFPEKHTIKAEMGWGNRTQNITKQQQFFTSIQATYHFQILPKQSFFIKNNTYLLKSDTYIANELPQFGGVQSLRGFADNSLIAHKYTTFLTEYRYQLSSNLYIHTVTDFGLFTDKLHVTNGSLFSLGAGLGLLTQGGLFQLIYANGQAKTKNTKFSNTLVHIKYNIIF